MSWKNDCPYQVKPFTEDEDEVFHRHIHEETRKMYRVGPKGYVLPETFLRHANHIRHFPLRSDDVFVSGYLRSGTTWTDEMVWLMSNNLDYERAKSTPLNERCYLLEVYMFGNPQTDQKSKLKVEFGEDLTENIKLKKILEQDAIFPVEFYEKHPSPRCMKTHVPPSLLPSELLNTAKVVYVARNVLDVAVSLYHFKKSIKKGYLVTPFKDFYKDFFTKNLGYFSPYFEHVKEGWAMKDHPNVLFLFYEDLSKDLRGTARRVADFLGKTYTDQQLDELCDHLKFDNFQKNKAVYGRISEIMKNLKEENNFIRKGKVGGWREHFDEDMTRHAENWIKQELQGTTFTYPQ